MQAALEAVLDLDADGLSGLDALPRAMTVVGGGVTGLEYASLAAALGIRVTVVERRPRLLEFVDAEIVEALQYHLRDLGVTFRLGEDVSHVERRTDGTVLTHLHSGKQIPPTSRSTPPDGKAPPPRCA